MHRVVILFGAGASYGAGGIVPEAPPLGTALYDALVVSYPNSWGALPPDTRIAFSREGFELGMKLVFEQYGGAIPQLMREMAVYFIQFRSHAKQSLYSRLIRNLISADVLKQIAFATLNYECILEFALLEEGLIPSYFPENSEESGPPVWKLHGSCNMFAQGIQASQGVTYGTGVVWEGGAQAFFDSNRVIEHCLVETGLAPIMSLYMEGKPINVSPGVITQIQTAWRASVQSASAVFVIGVRPVLRDAHIWEPLAASIGTLYFVGDKASFDIWCAEHRISKPSKYLGSRFNEAYAGILQQVIAHATN